METIYESAYAKINLTLDVLGKRQDGYHDLKSVMQTISLCDDIKIDIGTHKPWKLICSNALIPQDETNLAWKAAELFFRTCGIDPKGVQIHITKRIPSEAGLGGGSADAGAVLRALNRHYGCLLSLMDLAKLGSQVGSDVPFCTICGTAMAEGRGERLRALANMPECYIVVCKPCFSSSTPVLYRKIDECAVLEHPKHSVFERALSDSDLDAIARNLYNVFDPIVTHEHPEINEIKEICFRFGAIGQQMTGSGSAVFAITRDYQTATTVFEALKARYSLVYITKPV